MASGGGDSQNDADTDSTGTETNGFAPGAHGTEGKARHRHRKTSESSTGKAERSLESKYTPQEAEAVKK